MDIMDYIEISLLLSLIVLAIMIIEARKLRRSVIYMGAFSLLSSFVYLIYNAPDVAIAEAFIGCTISVVLFLTALKKYKIMTIFYVHTEGAISVRSKAFSSKLLQSIETYLIDRDFEPQLVKSDLHDTSLHEKEDFDLLLVNEGPSISIYSAKTNYHTPLLSKFIENYPKNNDFTVTFISLKEEIDEQE